MKLIDLAGSYRGDVTWFDSFGESGALSEVTSVKPMGGGGVVEGAVIEQQDGSSLKLDSVDGVHGLFTVRRDEEGIVGRAFLTEHSLAIDYLADVPDGLQENITDTWHLDGVSITRTGLIRQSNRIIWFEADMIRVG